LAALQNAHLAIVDERKRRYLLSASHPAGRTKAIFFERFGFRASAWRFLRGALVAHAASGEVTSEMTTPFGIKYTVEGPVAAPDGRNPWVLTVWFRRNGETAPRLVTAYPVFRSEQ
jgi:hypothetical protein